MNPAPPTTAAFGNLAVSYRQSRGNVLLNLNANVVTSWRNQFDAGYLRPFALLGEQIADTDDTAGTVVDKRCGRVARRTWEVVIGEDVPDYLQDQARLHQAELKYFYSNLRVQSAVELNETGDLQLLLRQMMRAVFNRYAAHEIAWSPSNAGITATLWHMPIAMFEATQGDLRFCGPSGGMAGMPLESQNWLFSVHHRCLMKALAALYVVKRYTMTDWLNFSEKFGTPGLHMETTATPGSPEWLKAEEALANYARDWAMVSSPGQKVNLIQASAAGGEGPFAPLIDLANRAMTRVALGSDLATMSRENGAGASLQDEETDEIIADDCGWAGGLLNTQLSTRVIEWRFGAGTMPLAYLRINPPTREDTKLEMAIDEHVGKFGVKLSPKDVAERYGRTHVEPEVVTPPAQQPAPAPAANERPRPSETLRGKQGSRRALLLTRIQAALKGDLKKAAAIVEKIEAAKDPAAELDEIDLAELAEEIFNEEGLDLAFEELLALELLGGLRDDSNDASEDDEDEAAANARYDGRWAPGTKISGKNVGGRFKPKGLHDTVGSLIDDAALHGGFTISLAGDRPSKGYAVAPRKDTERILDFPLKPEEVDRYIADWWELLQLENAHLGGWVNRDDGKVYLDVSLVLTGYKEAASLAKAGDQIAFFDLERKKEIRTDEALSTTAANEAEARGSRRRSLRQTPQRRDAGILPGPRESAPDEPGRDAAGSEVIAAANEGIPLAQIQVAQGEGLFMPFGQYTHSVGLQLVDAESARLMSDELGSVWGRVLRAFSGDGFAGAPVYVGHPDHHDMAVRALYKDRRAYGWCKGIVTMSDGMLFRVKWNDLGKAAIEKGHYAYHSPYWLLTRVTTPDGKPAVRPHKLVSIGLTNQPNIIVPSLIQT